MHGVSRLLFAWLLLAGIVSLLVGAARLEGKTPLHHETSDKNGSKAPLFIGDGATGPAGDLAAESKPDQGANPNDCGAPIAKPGEQGQVARFFTNEPTWREFDWIEALPIRGPPAGLHG